MYFPVSKKVLHLTCFLKSDLKFTLGLELTNYYSNMQRKGILVRQCLLSGHSQVSFQLNAHIRKTYFPEVKNQIQLGIGIYHR